MRFYLTTWATNDEAARKMDTRRCTVVLKNVVVEFDVHVMSMFIPFGVWYVNVFLSRFVMGFRRRVDRSVGAGTTDVSPFSTGVIK